jgi:hypothetical protein
MVTGKTMQGQRSSVEYVPTQHVRPCIGCGALAYEQVQRHCMSGLPIAARDLGGARNVEAVRVPQRTTANHPERDLSELGALLTHRPCT